MKRAPESAIFSFLKLYKIFKESFWNTFEWLHQRGKTCTSYFRGGRKQYMLCKIYILKIFLKTLLNNKVADLFHLKSTQRTHRHSKSAPTALHGALGTQVTQALEAIGHSKDTWVLGHSSTWGTRRALGYSSTQDTRALVHSGTWALRHLRHFISQTRKTSKMELLAKIINGFHSLPVFAKKLLRKAMSLWSLNMCSNKSYLSFTSLFYVYFIVYIILLRINRV